MAVDVDDEFQAFAKRVVKIGRNINGSFVTLHRVPFDNPAGESEPWLVYSEELSAAKAEEDCSYVTSWLASVMRSQALYARMQSGSKGLPQGFG